MERHWVVVGDSYSDPGHSGYVEHGVRSWPLLVAERTGIDVHCYASSGDGFVHVRRVSFPDQARQAAADESYDHALVERAIVYGGINDFSMGESAETVRAAVAQTARTLIEAFPAAKVEGFMNWYPREYGVEAKAFVAAIRAGYADAGVNMRDDCMWILENDRVTDAYLDDNLHPNQHGQNLIADYFEALG